MNQENKKIEKDLVIAEIEAGFLGIIIRDNSAYSRISQSIKPEMFHFKQNQILFQAIQDLVDQGIAFDVTELSLHLEKQKLMDQIAFKGMTGFEYLNYVYRNSDFVKNLEHNSKVIIDQYKIDKLIALVDKTKQTMENEPFEISKLIDELQLALININISELNTEYRSVYEVAKEIIDSIKTNQEDESTGLKFGYEELDKLVLGSNPGDLVILAARPSMGKTAFATNIAIKVAKAKKNVLFFSLEMTNAQIVERMLAIESSVPISLLKKGDKSLTTHDWSFLHAAMNTMKGWNLHLNDKPTLNISELKTLANKFGGEKKIVDLVIVDYLQLIGDLKSSGDNRQLEVAKISRSLKQLARELECPIIALSQLSRNVERREDKMPIMSDLRESGGIEQDADLIMFLYRADYYQKHKTSYIDKSKSESDEYLSNEEDNKKDDDSAETSVVEVIVAKNRHGATGRVSLFFDKPTNRFYYRETKDKSNK
ncbi:replicative DNA helicase [Metamycoplasma subdolum]|uniref:Replicative DNA helicase n=1 Tax=Metamycoplasma subdolum TaxID=92407 RepID=A0A3M0A4B8_9BACT|nr:replicative DNA helicase [Metamycoplasma subdolum]RMA77598.1 replicative DNA helicase [Metamycoplasma subdolum]WPB50392.1 replicative DNA helicase [Metamycoplasma subdolum]